MELQCTVQNYDWGKKGGKSMVARLVSSADRNAVIDPEKPYAELWMGTHPNGPSLIIEREVLLSDYIKGNADAIGPVVQKKFGLAVPFLLKVLSVQKALSIQAHPNKEHAEELHKNFPDMYKDPNHKPELAIALTDFEALCGFRPVDEIKDFLSKVPELTAILSEDSVSAFQTLEQGAQSGDALKKVFESLMTASKEAIADGLLKLLARLGTEDTKVQESLLYPLIQRLHADFPGDVGCWAPYIMNYLVLRAGQAIFLEPNMPHAYISGDCVECMACSDNVVRAGLTPKHLDVDTLVRMLQYGSRAPDQLLFAPRLEDEHSCIWRPPVPDFAVVKIKLGADETYNTIMRPSPSIFLFTAGAGEACDCEPVAIQPGVVMFLKASRQLTLSTRPGGGMELFQAICNV